jgi:predicted porin
LTDEFALKLSGQYTKQQSIGDELIGDLDTAVFGARAALSYKNAILRLAYTSTDDQTIRSPYGGYPGFISLIISDFNRASEDAWLVGLSYDFSRFGWDELSGFINYASSETPDDGINASPDQWEFDITLDYVFDTAPLDGFWIRARAAHLDQEGVGATDANDYRIILNYSLPLH